MSRKKNTIYRFYIAVHFFENIGVGTAGVSDQKPHMPDSGSEGDGSSARDLV